METITVPNFRTNREVAEMFGCTPEYIRKLKSTKADELEGLWENNNPDGETTWNEEGVEKLSELIKTDKAKEYRASALARRTQEAIAVDRSELNYGESLDSPRTGQDINSYEVPSPTAQGGRYADLPEKMGDMISDRMIDDGAIARMDKRVATNLLKAANLSDIGIDLDALLGKH
ncbi:MULTISPECIES: hypothetical protein [Pseudanabaena]|jgi:hypothetical protein|uniref:hypothetical protein n=1 Tax=Pseudanabaena TaxID=1152 RepID=UPI002478597B|nr:MULTISPECIES: hypothetical protein [Pseudanabaena]MEA5487482.1 hypothetical protein [Pseudanabaena sp. CCNP1317]WGS74041.1 hypothetical protein OA858_08445 [Pseudanabaena galeata CCNP1313]